MHVYNIITQLLSMSTVRNKCLNSYKSPSIIIILYIPTLSRSVCSYVYKVTQLSINTYKTVHLISKLLLQWSQVIKIALLIECQT